MKTRWLIFSAAVCLAIWFWGRVSPNESPTPDNNASENKLGSQKKSDQELKPPVQRPQRPLPQNAEIKLAVGDERTAVINVVNPDIPATETKETVYPTRDEFIARFRAKDFKAWLAQSIPYRTTSSEGGLNNGLAWDRGIIVTPQGEFEYRYWVNMNDQEELKPHSCISIRPPDGPLIVGSAFDNSLTVFRLPTVNGRIYRIQDKHFFVSYGDATESRQRDTFGEPTNPLLLKAWLYYTQKTDGKFVYHGKLERWSDDRDYRHEMEAQEFCRFTNSSR